MRVLWSDYMDCCERQCAYPHRIVSHTCLHSLSQNRVALITYSGVPAITTDDRLLRDALVARGAEVDARPWDARADWGSYHRIVLRSCWNFHHHPAEFLLWVNEVKESHDGSLRNSPALVQWSVDKRYLLDLDAEELRSCRRSG